MRGGSYLGTLFEATANINKSRSCPKDRHTHRPDAPVTAEAFGFSKGQTAVDVGMYPSGKGNFWKNHPNAERDMRETEVVLLFSDKHRRQNSERGLVQSAFSD